MPSMIFSNFNPVSSVPSDSLQIRNVPPGFKIRQTSAKQVSSPGQNYTVSNAVARSKDAPSKGSDATFSRRTVHRPAAIAF